MAVSRVPGAQSGPNGVEDEFGFGLGDAHAGHPREVAARGR
jgi:hypothetical protein